MSECHECEVLREQRNAALDKAARSEAECRKMDQQMAEQQSEMARMVREREDFLATIEDLKERIETHLTQMEEKSDEQA